MSGSRGRRHVAVRRLLESPSGGSAVRELGRLLPDETGRWLARLCLLEGLPFADLVPDARMLPAESIRFFFLDRNWVDALVDGALSVASAAAPEAALVDLHRPDVHRRARAGAHHERGRRRVRTRDAAVAALGARLEAAGAGAGEAEAPPWSGFLLRSAAVAAWPGLTVTGFATTGRDEPLGLLRLDRPAPSVLLALFDGVVRRVEVAKPSQALHFGVTRPDADDPPVVYLRYVGGGPDFTPGEQPAGDPSVEVPWRDEARGVVDVTGLVGRLQAGLDRAYAPAVAPRVNPGAFGIEMVAAAERQPFVTLPRHAPPPRPAAPPAGTDPPVTVGELLEALRRGR